MQSQSKFVQRDRKKESQFMRFFTPALLAILIHLLFFGFKKVPPADITSKSSAKQVMLLPLDSKVPDEQRLLAWMNILDSSCVIQPNRKYGFSTTFKPAELSNITLKLKNATVDDGTERADFLPVPWQDQHNRIKRLWVYKSISITPVNPKEYKRNLNCPAWLNEEDEILPQLFDNINELKAAVKKSPPPRQETVLKVTFLRADLFPKVKITSSCGLKKLDSAALRTFTVNSENIPTTVEHTIRSYYITVKWYAK